MHFLPALILLQEASNPQRGILSDIKVEEVDVAHVVIFIGP